MSGRRRALGEVRVEPASPKREAEANLFAMELLVPSKLLAAEVRAAGRDLLDDGYLVEIAARYQEPIALVVLQLQRCGFFDGPGMLGRNPQG